MVDIGGERYLLVEGSGDRDRARSIHWTTFASPTSENYGRPRQERSCLALLSCPTLSARPSSKATIVAGTLTYLWATFNGQVYALGPAWVGEVLGKIDDPRRDPQKD